MASSGRHLEEGDGARVVGSLDELDPQVYRVPAQLADRHTVVIVLAEDLQDQVRLTAEFKRGRLS